MATEMTLQEAISNATAWRGQMMEAQKVIETIEYDSPEKSAARRKYNEARQALEWYEGYYEIPSEVKRKAMAENGGHYSREEIDRRDMIFHEGLIQKLSGKAQRLKESSNLGERFLNRTFTSFEKRRDPSAFERAAAYANRDTLFSDANNSLLFIGSPGTGKTHLAAAIANRLVEIGIPARFGTFQAHLDNIKKEFDTSGQRRYLDEIRGVPMLVIDDLGQERRTDWTKSVLYDVVNYRYEHLLPMVMTTNLRPDDFANYCGTAVWSRLYEMCDTIMMNGADYRQTKGGAY